MLSFLTPGNAVVCAGSLTCQSSLAQLTAPARRLVPMDLVGIDIQRARIPMTFTAEREVYTVRNEVDASEMSPVRDVIRARRSIGKVTPEAPPESDIRQILEAGTWAPNHHMTEPWRFVVLSGDARAKLGEAMGRAAARRETDPERAESAAARAAGKPMRAPWVIGIGVEPNPGSPELEEIAAGCAAAQNMLLAAHEMGLGAIWRSGAIVFEPEVREFMGLSEQGSVLGFIYVGYPAMEPPARERRPVDNVTEWRS